MISFIFPLKIMIALYTEFRKIVILVTKMNGTSKRYIYSIHRNEKCARFFYQLWDKKG
jgi:hypothetical protein